MAMTADEVKGGLGRCWGCTVSPGFEFEDYESGRVEELVAGWLAWEREIRELTREEVVMGESPV